jgi:hypothetical protein
MKGLSETQYILVQMAIGTFVVGLSPIFWDLARFGSMVFFLGGMGIILHTIYTDLKRTNRITNGLQTQIEDLRKRIVELKNESAIAEKDVFST